MTGSEKPFVFVDLIQRSVFVATVSPKNSRVQVATDYMDKEGFGNSDYIVVQRSRRVEIHPKPLGLLGGSGKPKGKTTKRRTTKSTIRIEVLNHL